MSALSASIVIHVTMIVLLSDCRCIAHTLQLAINDSLGLFPDELSFLQNIISLTRRSVNDAARFAAIQMELAEAADEASGQPPLAKFRRTRGIVYPNGLNPSVLTCRNARGPIKLPTIGATRWNSTFYAIKALVQVQAAVRKFLNDDPDDAARLALLRDFNDKIGALSQCWLSCCGIYLSVKIPWSLSR